MNERARCPPPTVVHVTSGHQPSDARVFAKECVTLVDAGYNVRLLAPHFGDLKREGVVIRGLNPPTGRFSRLVLRQPGILIAALREQADIYHIHDPELIPAGLVLSAMGRRVVRDVHEDLPRDMLDARAWIPQPLRHVMAACARSLEAATAPVFEAIVTATCSIAERFSEHRTVVVRNFPRLDDFETVCLPYEKRPANVVYAGLITAERGALTLESAMDRLDEGLEATLLMAGRIEPREFRRQLHHHPSSSRVAYLGVIDAREIPTLLGRRGRIGLAIYADKVAFVEALPTKVFEYMAAGLPVVASDIDGWSRIVRDEGCGLLVDPSRADEVADAIEYLLTHPREAAEMGRRGREAVRRCFGWEREGRKLVQLYEDILSGVV